MITKIDQLLKRIEKYNPKYDRARILRAWEFAKKAHQGQKRKTGEDFIMHPLNVANTLTYWKLDDNSIVAALLHDTIEDTPVTREEVSEEFGEDVARIVDGVTKVTNVRLKGSKQEEFVETLRKMILVMAKDIRVVLLKLADRLHNMRTLDGLSEEKQYANALETLEIYAPLAERLGMGEIKGSLQDLAFPYVHNKEYKKLVKDSQKYYEHAQKYLHSMERKFVREIKEARIDVDVKGRKKHYYSLWKKLQRDNIEGDYEKVSDIVAFRIIVPTVADCYQCLGIVHSLYKPVPNMTLSDYIAQPKPNGYQSLHTKVFGEGGNVVEIQIRTRAMHAQAEHGAAAHWAYSEAKSKGAKDEKLENSNITIDNNQNWVQTLVNWHTEITDTEEFLEAVKLDVFKSRILVFSPKGDVYDLPQGATGVDYAYAVHSDLGKHIGAIIVNGAIRPLHAELSNGDMVEIKKVKHNKGPYKDWLDHAVTTKARTAIRKQLRMS